MCFPSRRTIPVRRLWHFTARSALAQGSIGPSTPRRSRRPPELGSFSESPSPRAPRREQMDPTIVKTFAPSSHHGHPAQRPRPPPTRRRSCRPAPTRRRIERPPKAGSETIRGKPPSSKPLLTSAARVGGSSLAHGSTRVRAAQNSCSTASASVSKPSPWPSPAQRRLRASTPYKPCNRLPGRVVSRLAAMERRRPAPSLPPIWLAAHPLLSIWMNHPEEGFQSKRSSLATHHRRLMFAVTALNFTITTATRCRLRGHS